MRANQFRSPFDACAASLEILAVGDAPRNPTAPELPIAQDKQPVVLPLVPDASDGQMDGLGHAQPPAEPPMLGQDLPAAEPLMREMGSVSGSLCRNLPGSSDAL